MPSRTRRRLRRRLPKNAFNSSFFQKGNKWWQCRYRHGPHPVFEEPEELVDAFMEYVEWNENNPLYEAKLVSHRGISHIEKVPKMRVLTITSFCIFIGISGQTWRDWRKERPDLAGAMLECEEAIRNQKYTGAASDFFNSNIISRDLGLSDKQELSGPGGEPLEFEVKIPGVTDVETDTDSAASSD